MPAARIWWCSCVAGVARSERHYRVDLREGARLDEAVQAVAARVAPNRLEVVRPTLEDIFVGIVADGGRSEEAA